MRTKARSQMAAVEVASALEDPLGLTGPNPARKDGEGPERGFMAGRLVDGYDLAIDGQKPIHVEPPWIRNPLEDGGGVPIKGTLTFVVTGAGSAELASFATIREALRFARTSILAGRAEIRPDELSIACRTESGRSVPVAAGESILGMARGALDTDPIREISAPADFEIEDRRR